MIGINHNWLLLLSLSLHILAASKRFEFSIATSVKDHLMKLEMICTGEEVLAGQIVDTNAAWFASTMME